jgi:hypothetical protein
MGESRSQLSAWEATRSWRESGMQGITSCGSRAFFNYYNTIETLKIALFQQDLHETVYLCKLLLWFLGV